MTDPVIDASRPCYRCGLVKRAEELGASGPRGYPICRSCVTTDIDAGTPAGQLEQITQDAARQPVTVRAKNHGQEPSHGAWRRAAAETEVKEQAGWNGAFWILGYPVGVFLLLVIEFFATIAERGCWRFGDCPGGLSDWFIVRIRALNGGPPQGIEWAITLVLLFVVAWFGWHHLRRLTIPIARLQIAVTQGPGHTLGPDRAAARPPNSWVRIRVATPEERARLQRPGRFRRAVGYSFFFVVWLIFASIGVVTPWLIALLVLLAVP